MYCKNCGRKLEEGTRFCDRCGQSVRQSQNTGKEARQREIKELQEERRNRKQRLAEKEAKKDEKKVVKHKKKKNGALIFFVAVLLIMLVSAVTAYVIYSSGESPITGENSAAVNIPTSIPDADATPVPTAIPTAQPSDDMPGNSLKTNKESVDADNSKYKRVYVTEDVEFAYPSSFTKTTSDNENAVLALKESSDNAKITVYESEYPGGTASSLMKSFATKTGGTLEYSRAGSNWYVVTINKNNTIHHRKYIITNNDSVIYYDFEYPSLSSSADQYEDYTEYMDEQLELH